MSAAPQLHLQLPSGPNPKSGEVPKADPSARVTGQRCGQSGALGS